MVESAGRDTEPGVPPSRIHEIVVPRHRYGADQADRHADELQCGEQSKSLAMVVRDGTLSGQNGGYQGKSERASCEELVEASRVIMPLLVLGFMSILEISACGVRCS